MYSSKKQNSVFLENYNETETCVGNLKWFFNKNKRSSH